MVLRVLSKFKPVLEEKKIRKLLSKDQQGNLKSRNTIIEHNYKLIIRYAGMYKYFGAAIDFEDLFQEGVLGLIDAIRTFNLRRKDIKFSTWAVPWIKQKIYRYCNNHDRLIKTPEHLSIKIRQIKAKRIKKYP